jgi:hypothetical protein
MEWKESEIPKPCWREEWSNFHGKFYYINIETGESQWGRPQPLGKTLAEGWEEYVSEIVMPGKSYYRLKSSNHSQWKRPSDTPVENPIPPLGWKIKFSKCGNLYYINIEKNKSQWKKP